MLYSTHSVLRKLRQKHSAKAHKMYCDLCAKIWSFRENPTLDSGTTCHNELSFLFIYQKKPKESMVRAENRKNMWVDYTCLYG